MPPPARLRVPGQRCYASAMPELFAGAISFDAGYTLVEPLREANAIVAELLNERGITPDAAVFEAAHRRAEQLFAADYLRPLSDTWTADRAIQAFYVKYYAQFLADLQAPDVDGSDGVEIIRRYLAPDNWRLYDDVLPALRRLRQAGLRLGVASDWGSSLFPILHSLGLSRYFDWAVVSGAVGFAKPSPQFYRIVVQRANLPAERIVHVGDNYYADVRGARTVGMQAVLVERRGRALPPLDVQVIRSLTELRIENAELRNRS